MNKVNQVFGYVLKSNTTFNVGGAVLPTSYPWADPRRWSNAPGKLGNFRSRLADAQVFKRVPKGYTLEVVPVYADPKFVGEKALVCA